MHLNLKDLMSGIIITGNAQGFPSLAASLLDLSRAPAGLLQEMGHKLGVELEPYPTTLAALQFSELFFIITHVNVLLKLGPQLSFGTIKARRWYFLLVRSPVLFRAGKMQVGGSKDLVKLAPYASFQLLGVEAAGPG